MLNKQQQAVIDSESKKKAVIAGAGSGKTHTIVRLIKADTERLDIESDNMAAITFTRYAAGELTERLEAVGVNTKHMFAGTIHGFCLSILTDYIHKINWEEDFVLFDQEDREDIMKYITTTMKILPRGMTIYKALEDDKYGPRLIAEYESMMQEFNAIDLKMIIDKTVELLRMPDVLKRVQEQYKAFYVDEFQDTYQEQIDILKLINPDYITVIGDPDQAIYEWNKAKPEYLVNIADTFPGIEMFKLETNYRSTNQIVDTANRLVRNNVNRVDKTLQAIRDGNPINYSLDHFTENAEFDFISNHLKGNIAIICRKNATATAIGDYLINKGIKVNMMLSSKDIMKKDHVKSILYMCRAALNPNDDYSLMKTLRFLKIIPIKELMQIFSDCMAQGLPLKSALTLDSRLSNGELDKLYTLNDKVLNTDAYEFVKELLSRFDISSIFDSQHRQTKVLEIGMFKELVKKWKSYQAFGFKDTSIYTFLRWVMMREVQDDYDRKKDVINIMTVHGSKGLEFDNVFIPHVFKGEYPMTRSDNIEEERRLMYVAVTRAKNNLTLSSCDRRKIRNGYELDTVESIFIKEMTE